MSDLAERESPAPPLLRDRSGVQRVTNIELFFDLVYVFAVTQLSHYLIGHSTVAGALQTGLLLAMVWLVWSYTTWVTNWLDPERMAVRLLLVVLMLVSLAMSVSLSPRGGLLRREPVTIRTEPPLEEPRRLALLLGDVPDGVLVQALREDVLLDVRHEPMFVLRGGGEFLLQFSLGDHEAHSERRGLEMPCPASHSILYNRVINKLCSRFLQGAMAHQNRGKMHFRGPPPRGTR